MRVCELVKLVGGEVVPEENIVVVKNDLIFAGGVVGLITVSDQFLWMRVLEIIGQVEIQGVGEVVGVAGVEADFEVVGFKDLFIF